MMVKIARITTDLLPTIIVLIVVVLLAVVIVYNSNRNQREIIETVREAVRARKESEAAARMDAAIKSRLKEPENWQKATDLMKAD